MQPECFRAFFPLRLSSEKIGRSRRVHYGFLKGNEFFFAEKAVDFTGFYFDWYSVCARTANHIHSWARAHGNETVVRSSRTDGPEMGKAGWSRPYDLIHRLILYSQEPGMQRGTARRRKEKMDGSMVGMGQSDGPTLSIPPGPAFRGAQSYWCRAGYS
jgi:hypothetical protein